ncbi:MAG: DUF6893 family small protein [Candidatus Binataceae bacterium]
MSGWVIFLIVVVALVVFGILSNLRDILRYLRIRAM